MAHQAFPGVLAVLAVVHERRKPLYRIGRASTWLGRDALPVELELSNGVALMA